MEEASQPSEQSPEPLSDAAAEPATGSEGERSSGQSQEPPRFERPHGLERSRKLAAAAAQVALDNRAQDVLVLDVSGQTALFDYFVIATGSSRRQLHAISDEIDDRLQKEMGDRRLGVEGFEESRWIVLDYGSVVIHLFDEEMRSYYDLESLWADAQRIDHQQLGLVDHSRRGQ